MPERVAYLDYGSTTPLRRSAREAMKPYLTDKYGNASSLYKLGRESRAAVEDARELVASLLGVSSREIIFTSGGTESLITSLIGAFVGNRHRGSHIITTRFEHHATHAIFNFLRDEMDAETEMVGIDSDGIVRMDELESMLRDNTVLVSVMHVNNELGTIQDLEAVVELCSSKGIIVHSDCVQAIGKMPVNLADMGVDLACASGHKFGGPKGVGILFIKEGTYIESICKGSHEFGIRSGTENIPGIVGIAVALAEVVNEIPELGNRLQDYGNQLWNCIKEVVPDAEFNGDRDKCVSATMNVHLPDCDGETLVMALDREGIALSTGSACQTENDDPSHVLYTIGLCRLMAQRSIRLSMGYATTQEDIDKFVRVFPQVYSQVMSASVS